MKIKVTFVITGLSTGGAEMMLFKLLEHIDRNRTELHVFSLTTMGELGGRIAALGIPVEALGMRPGLPSPLAFMRLVKRLRDLRPDLVHTWMYHADLLGAVCRNSARYLGHSKFHSGSGRDQMEYAFGRVVVRPVVDVAARQDFELFGSCCPGPCALRL